MHAPIYSSALLATVPDRLMLNAHRFHLPILFVLACIVFKMAGVSVSKISFRLVCNLSDCVSRSIEQLVHTLEWTFSCLWLGEINVNQGDVTHACEEHEGAVSLSRSEQAGHSPRASEVKGPVKCHQDWGVERADADGENLRRNQIRNREPVNGPSTAWMYIATMLAVFAAVALALTAIWALLIPLVTPKYAPMKVRVRIWRIMPTMSERRRPIKSMMKMENKSTETNLTTA